MTKLKSMLHKPMEHHEFSSVTNFLSESQGHSKWTSWPYGLEQKKNYCAYLDVKQSPLNRLLQDQLLIQLQVLENAQRPFPLTQRLSEKKIHQNDFWRFGGLRGTDEGTPHRSWFFFFFHFHVVFGENWPNNR